MKPSQDETTVLLKEYMFLSFVACVVIMYIAKHNHTTRKAGRKTVPLLFLPVAMIKWLFYWDSDHHHHHHHHHHHKQGQFHHDNHQGQPHYHLNRQDAFGSSSGYVS
eukprot:73523_1